MYHVSQKFPPLISLCCFLSVGRRRSSRLIESPWVFNLPKKQPLFLNLDEDENINNTIKVDGWNTPGNGKKSGNLGGQSSSSVLTRQDIRIERIEDDRL